MKKILLSALLLAATAGVRAQSQMSCEEADRRADVLLQKMTLEEKISMTHGYSRFFFNGVERVGIPYIYLSDATQGVNMRDNLPDPAMVKQLERSTAFPAPILLAATFDPEMASRYARCIGEEARAGGVEVMLGPGLNIYRNSQCGRNFEYFGEDPCLVSQMVAHYVKGMQSTGTAACLKHFVANNTEFYRRRSNSLVGERALNEIYMPGFKAGIDADVACVMTSYNRVDGEWAGQSAYVIDSLLRRHLGFKGVVMTDWNSVYDLEKVVKSGQNVVMPGDWAYYEKQIPDLIRGGKLTEGDIERMIRPQLAACIRFGLYDRTGTEKYKPELLRRMRMHEADAFEVASEGVVLLKNDGLLPLDKSVNRTILVTGRFLDEIPRGRGSAAVMGYHNISLRQALTEVFGRTVEFAEKPTGEQLKRADVVLVSVGTVDAEAIERPFALPSAEEKAVRRAVDMNPRTVVLVNSGSGIRMTDWAGKAAAVLYGWYPGQNGFGAIARILAGEINPSGKLPMSIEKEFSDSPACGVVPRQGKLYDKCSNEYLIQLYDVDYKEGVLVGYRWYDTKGIEPLFPFGYGLSYTRFELTKPGLSATKCPKDGTVTLTVTLKNTGDSYGAEVVQLYVGERSPRVERPVKELRDFRKLRLIPGESEVLTFEVPYRAFAYWSDAEHGWKVDPGRFDLMVGTSSRDIAFSLPVEVE